jgi:hypothetical protein
LGTFAADGQTLEATETWSYRLASGEVIEMRSRWAGSHLSR